MLYAERKRKILEYIHQKPSVTVTELSEIFSVSGVTIRKVLNELSKEGKIERTHGGALNISPSQHEEIESAKEVVNSDFKSEIAEKTLRFIIPGDSIIIDAGSTTLELAKKIVENQIYNLTIITNAFNIAEIFRENNKYNLIFLGGQYRQGILSCVGPLTLSTLNTLHADKCFLGANGISLEFGFTTPNILEAEVKKAMIRNSSESFMLADSTKISNVFLSKIADISSIDFLICDSSLKPELRSQLLTLGINVK